MPLPVRAESKPLNPEIERILYQVQVLVEEAEGLVDGVNEDAFNWQPEPGRWSIGQNFQHLIVTGNLMLDEIEAATAKGRQEGKLSDGPFAYGFLGRWFHRLMLPPVKNRFKAPKKFDPQQRLDMAKVLEAWTSLHARARKAAENASGVDLAALKVSSPAASFIKYQLGIAFWIMTGHEKRHLWQARNVRNAPGFPA
jgi:hypothetical protein